jgi:hypothetical protein
MKTFLATILVCAVALGHSRAATSINLANKFSYGANFGWMDWRGDPGNGAIIGQFVCSGFIYAANVGWINLGDGTPANGIRYQNNSAGDFGVNHDGLGNLSGYAWGTSIGWLTFSNRDSSGVTYAGPAVDLFTGRLTGSVWSANCGWISLSNAQGFVQTDHLPATPDSDGDGIPDAWELLKFANLTAADAVTDFDHDGFSDLNEYLADTDPIDPDSLLRITALAAAGAGATNTLTWTSVSTRQYRVFQTNDVAAASPWIEVGLGLIPPDAGATTARTVTNGATSRRFFRVQAVKPLSP